MAGISVFFTFEIRKQGEAIEQLLILFLTWNDIGSEGVIFFL